MRFVYALAECLSIFFLSAALSLPIKDLFYVPSCIGNISQAEYSALETFYQSTGGPHWRTSGNQTKWGFPSSLSAPCENAWQGIVCEQIKPVERNEVMTCTVTSLLLPYTELRGYLPTQLAYLSSLALLYLDDNTLTVGFPLIADTNISE